MDKKIVGSVLLVLVSANICAEVSLPNIVVIEKPIGILSDTFGSEEIGHHGMLQSLNDALILSPSVDMYENGRRSALNVRGLGYTGGPPNPGIEPTNAVYLDGIYLPRSHLVSSELMSMEKVQVYKHAISAPNASAVGNILLETGMPSTREDRYFVEIGAGEQDSQRIGFGGNAAISSRAAINGYFFSHDSDGIYTNIDNDATANYVDNRGGYFKFLIEPIDDFKIDFFHTQINDKSDWTGTGRANSYLFTDAQRNFFDRLVPLAYVFAGREPPVDKNIYLPTEFSSDKIASDLDNTANKDDRISAINIGLKWDQLELHSTTAKIESSISNFTDLDNTNFNLVNQSLNENIDLLSEDIYLIYRGDKYSVKNGIYVAHSESSYQTINYGGKDLLYLRALIAENDAARTYILSMIDESEGYGRAAPITSRSFEEREQIAYYYQVDLDDSFGGLLSIGGNWTTVDKEFNKYHEGLCSYDSSHLPIAECAPTSGFVLDKYYFDGSIAGGEIGYSFFVEDTFDLGRNSAFFVNFSQMKNIGGYSQTQSIGGEEGYARSIEELYFKPEYIESISMKWTYSIPSVSTKFSINPFIISVKDYQLSYFDGLGFYTYNAEMVRSKGIEAVLDSEYFDSIRWISSAAYTDARYVENTGAPCPPVEYRTKENCNYQTWEEASAENDVLRSDLSGEKLRAPSLNISTLINRQLYDSAILTSDISLEAEYTGKTRTTEFVDARFERGGFTRYNIYLNASHLESDIDLEFSVSNITDKAVKVLEFPSPLIPKISNSPGGIDAFMYPRRHLNLLLRYNF